jgi:hypothetical protein
MTDLLFREHLAAGWRIGVIRVAAGLSLATVLIPLAAGCSGTPVPERVPVAKAKGAITYRGRAIPGAFLVLHAKAPLPDVPAPTAHVKDDGTFVISTYDGGDGAPPGQYVVTVQWQQLQKVAGEFAPGPNLLPARYAQPGTSDLVVQIAEGQNDLPALVLR